MTILQGILAPMRWLAKGCVALLFSYMAVAILAQVLGRYLPDLFPFAIDWTEESARYAQVWLIFLGAGLAQQERMHVGVDLLMQYLPAQARSVVVSLSSLLCLAFIWVTVQHSARLLAVGKVQTSPSLGLPLYYVYLALPVGLVYFGLEFLHASLLSLRNRSRA